MRGFSIDVIKVAHRIREILEEHNDWMQYEDLELKASRRRYISDYYFPFVMTDALAYLILCELAESKNEDDLVFYRKIGLDDN